MLGRHKVAYIIRSGTQIQFLSVRGELSILAMTNKKNRQSAIESPRLIAVGRTKVATFLFSLALQRGKTIWGVIYHQPLLSPNG